MLASLKLRALKTWTHLQSLANKHLSPSKLWHQLSWSCWNRCCSFNVEELLHSCPYLAKQFWNARLCIREWSILQTVTSYIQQHNNMHIFLCNVHCTKQLFIDTKLLLSGERAIMQSCMLKSSNLHEHYMAMTSSVLPFAKWFKFVLHAGFKLEVCPWPPDWQGAMHTPPW